MAPTNTGTTPHSLEETTYHFLATLTIPWGREGSRRCSCSYAVASVQNTGAAAAPFLYKSLASNPKTGKGWGMGPKPKHGHDLWLRHDRQKKKNHKRKLMSNTRSSSPLLCRTLHCHLPQSVLYSNQRIFWASQNAINPHWEWNRAHLHWSLYSSNHYSMLAWTGGSYRQRWVLEIK